MTKKSIPQWVLDANLPIMWITVDRNRLESLSHPVFNHRQQKMKKKPTSLIALSRCDDNNQPWINHMIMTIWHRKESICQSQPQWCRHMLEYSARSSTNRLQRLQLHQSSWSRLHCRRKKGGPCSCYTVVKLVSPTCSIPPSRSKYSHHVPKTWSVFLIMWQRCDRYFHFMRQTSEYSGQLYIKVYLVMI
jgi:hypothetical protein